MDINALALALLALITGMVMGGGLVAWYVISSISRRAQKFAEQEAEVEAEMKELFKQIIAEGPAYEMENDKVKVTARKVDLKKRGKAKNDKSSTTNR